MSVDTRNQLLSDLSGPELERLLPLLDTVTLQSGDSLHHPGEQITHVYFPETTILAKMAILEDGSTTEVGIVGRDGMTGLCVFLARGTSPFRAVVQIGGVARRIQATDFLQHFCRSGHPMVDILLRYTSRFLAQVSYLAACNQIHSVMQRCCRMLLWTFDLLDAGEMAFTQDYLAFFLGVRRASIGEVMNKLKKAKVLTYSRGHIKLLDRPALESYACECYHHIRTLNQPTRDTTL